MTVPGIHWLRHCFLLAQVLLFLALAILTGCIKSPSAPATQEPSSITLSSYSIVLTSIGQRVLINTTVLDQDSKVIADATIFFRSGDEKIATVSNSGLVTAESIGSTQITVSSGYATASATVTVMQEAGSIEISPPSATLTMPGETVQLKAEVKDTGSTVIPGAAVVWSSSDPQYATVDANGLVTAVSSGTTKITATSGGVSTDRPVYVVIPKPAARIELNISQATLTSVGQSLQLDALVYDIESVAIPGAPVTWSSSHPAVATVSGNGLVSAVSNGTTLVTATLGGAFTFATISVVIEGTVPPPEPPVPSIARIEINPPSATLTEKGKTLQLAATVYDTNDEIIVGAPVAWSSNDPAVATVDAGGLVTAVGSGNTLITATIDIVSGSAAISVVTPSSDREALIAFYNATIGPDWTNDTNWLTDAPLGEWHGVRTDADGRVTELNLLENNLTGVIPPEIGQLQNLTLLVLTHNRLTGIIPPEIGHMSTLSYLRLSDNELIGEFPSEILQLRSLKVLALFGNQISGEIPSEIEQLTNLVDLFLANNQFSGEIPPEIGQLSNLDFLDLSDNQLIGGIPSEIGQLAKLRTLVLHGNQLSGGIPSEIGRLANLQGLLLHENRLTGEIPPEIGQLVNLNGLVLSENRLTGEIPPEIGQLAKLRGLRLSGNQLSGAIPAEIGLLSSLEILHLYDNELTGPIPPEIIRLSNLGEMDLSTNQLSGSLPPEFYQLANLKRLYLRENPELGGPLPLELTRLQVEVLRLEETRFCAPLDADFQAWLEGINDRSVENCTN